MLTRDHEHADLASFQFGCCCQRASRRRWLVRILNAIACAVAVIMAVAVVIGLASSNWLDRLFP